MCVCMCVCYVGVQVDVCVHIWENQRSTLGVFGCSLPHSLSRVSHWILSSVAVYLADPESRNSPVPAAHSHPQARVIGVHRHHAQLSGSWELKLRSLQWCGKHFKEWAIASPSHPLGDFFCWSAVLFFHCPTSFFFSIFPIRFENLPKARDSSLWYPDTILCLSVFICIDR